MQKDLEFRNNFQLQSFPFDKQILNIKLAGNSIEQYIDVTDTTYEAISDLIKNIKIPGWKVLGYEIKHNLYQDLHSLKLMLHQH